LTIAMPSALPAYIVSFIINESVEMTGITGE
jgi:hypothetical protein